MLPKNRPPTHPGEILLEEFLKPLNISQDQFAKYLDGTWTQPKISEIVNKKRRITESIALDFADTLSTSPEFWLNLQRGYDLWYARKNQNSGYKGFVLDFLSLNQRGSSEITRRT